MIESRQYTVKGRVQGIGYRFFLTRHACSADLKGWVCNEKDGSVSIRIEGPAFRLDMFEDALRKGPPGARIESVDREEKLVDGTFQRFEIVDPE